MIAVLFCGAIFASSSSILVSLNNFNEYVYGSEENVVIIYDRAAQTPFTSRVPASYDLILNQIPGVEITSPELMIPGVIKDQTALMRGVNITSFSEISTFSLRGDSDLRTEDRASVWIGANLANRLDVEIGDIVFFQGSLLNNGVTMKIIGVLSGSEQIEDEIIAPLALAEKLSRRVDEYNHIKVRYNPEITNQGEILALTTSFYETKISLMRNNGTERWGNITLQIFDKSGDQLLIQERKTVFLIDLPFGEYTFVFSENQTVVHQEIRFVSKSGDYEFILNDLSYRVYLSPIIQEKSGSIAFELIQQGTTLSSGYVDGETIERTLEVGNYEIVYISPIGSVTHSFAVSEASEHRHNLSKISYQPSILGLTNGSILSQNGILFINNTVSGDGLRVFIDDILYSTSSELLNYSLTPGEHSIVLKNSREIILRSYSVTINSTIGSSDQDHESIQINEYDPNYNLTSEYVGKTVLLSNQGKRVLVTVGEITSISTDVDAITIDGTQFVPDQDITLVKEIQTERLSITIINDLGLLTGDIHISHIILLNTSNPVNIGERWEVSEFPVGPIQILIERIGGVNRLFDFNFVPNEAIKIILEPTGEVQLYKYLALRTDISAD
ncbi:MAG: ABC transporter permease, partial [Candidatus Kariarchaeaceae archaeon]